MTRSVIILLPILFCSAVFAQESDAPDSELAEKRDISDPLGKKDSDLRFKASPIFVWAPIFVAEAEDPGGGPPIELDKPAPWLNGALFFRLGLEKSGWSLDSDLLYASIKGKNEESQNRSIRFDVLQLQIWAGRRVYRRISLLAGARRYSAKFTYSSDNIPEFSRKEVVWDPIVGVFAQPRISRKWSLYLNGDVGGFGVGSDLSASGTFFANWRFSRRFSLDLGYRILYLKFQDGADLKESTFHGPVFGLGIHF